MIPSKYIRTLRQLHHDGKKITAYSFAREAKVSPITARKWLERATDEGYVSAYLERYRPNLQRKFYICEYQIWL